MKPAVLAILVVSLLFATAARADTAQVTVVSPGGQARTLALDAMAGSEDVVNRAYALRSASGESSQTVTGFSIAALLDAAGADPFSFSYLEIQRPAGGSVQLSRDQALDDGAFPDGPPVLYATAAGTGFLRPSGGADDVNASDSFEAPQGISIVLRKGEPLQVRVQASPLRTRPGGQVSFKAIVERAGSGEQLSFSWYFDDGHSASGETARHSFAKRGSYDVVLGVTSEGDDAGTDAVVTIQVGPQLAGPDRKGGGTNENADAPDHGAAEGPGGGSSGSGEVGGVSESPAVTPQPPQPTAADPRPQPVPPPEPDGELVSGELLSAQTTPTPPSRQPAAARRGNPDEDGGDGGGVPTAAWGALATLGLLGLGALGEAGGLAAFRRGRWRAP